MKKHLLSFVSIAILALIMTSASMAKKPTRVIIIAFDGVRVDGLAAAKTPYVDALFAEGSASYATRNQMPSVTLVNFTSHLTGSGPEQHGVIDNTWTLNNIKLPPIETDADGYYPNVFAQLKKNVPGIKTAFYYTWKQVIYPHNKKYFDVEHYEKNSEFQKNCDLALQFVLDNQDSPMCVFLYDENTDHVGHVNGWMTTEYIDELEKADSEIGTFIEGLKKAGLYEDSYIFFITDHGGVDKGHGAVSKEEMIVPWAVRGPKIKKGYIIDSPHYTTSTAVDILRIFKVKDVPACWIGKQTSEIFK